MTIPWLPRRDNMIDRPGERWRPPLFRAPTSAWTHALAIVRRGLDLQAASIWRDLSHLLPHCRGALLDVGCGAQPYRPLVPRDVRYTGIDTANAQEHFGYVVRDTTYFEGDAWPVPDASVDTILATETLEHVPRPPQFLAEARRCLAPGGRLILTVPFAARWHFIPHDYWRFTPSSLRQLFDDAGLGDITVYARGNELTVLCYKSTTLILAWLFGQLDWSAGRLARRVVALALVPVLFVAAGVGQLSLLLSRGGDDCLGYTVIGRAREPTLDPVVDGTP